MAHLPLHCAGDEIRRLVVEIHPHPRVFRKNVPIKRLGAACL